MFFDIGATATVTTIVGEFLSYLHFDVFHENGTRSINDCNISAPHPPWPPQNTRWSRRRLRRDSRILFLSWPSKASGTSLSVLLGCRRMRSSPRSTAFFLVFSFNRTLGGSEFQRRLRDHLARTFNTNRKVKKDVFEDNKALQKLYKEAGRVKQVLSANADHFAQVENLADDEDFRAKVTREEFESLCADLFEGIGKTVQDALDVSQLTMVGCYLCLLTKCVHHSCH